SSTANLASSHFQTHNGDQEQAQKKEPTGICRFTEKQNTKRSRAGSTNAHPHAISRANRQRPRRDRKHEQANDDPRDGQQAGKRASESVRVFQADSPRRFENSRDK